MLDGNNVRCRRRRGRDSAILLFVWCRSRGLRRQQCDVYIYIYILFRSALPCSRGRHVRKRCRDVFAFLRLAYRRRSYRGGRANSPRAERKWIRVARDASADRYGRIYGSSCPGESQFLSLTGKLFVLQPGLHSRCRDGVIMSVTKEATEITLVGLVERFLTAFNPFGWRRSGTLTPSPCD